MPYIRVQQQSFHSERSVAQETKRLPERADQWSRSFATGRLEADFRYTFERKSLCGIGKSYVREEPREFARVLRLPIIVTATRDRRVVSQTDSGESMLSRM